MKKTILPLIAVMCVAVSAQAELIKLGTGRINSVSEAGAAISGISLTFEQPMVGMMAVASIQEALTELAGVFEQNKPVGFAVYTTKELPSILDMSSEELMFGDDPFPEEALAFAAMIPVAASPEAFFKNRGITEPVEGAVKIDDTMWVSVHDGYAVFSNNEDAAKLTKTELDSVLASKIQGAVAEIDISKLAMTKFVEFKMVSDRETLKMMRELEAEMEAEEDADAKAFGNVLDVTSMLTDFSEVQSRRSLKILQQVNSFGFGFSYDMAKGLSFDVKTAFDENSEMAKLMSGVRPMSPDLLEKIPASALLVGAFGENPLAFMESKGLLEDVLQSSVPKIKAEQLRASISDLLNAAIRTYNDYESGVFYIDRDSAGRYVAVGMNTQKDIASFKDFLAIRDEMLLNALNQLGTNQNMVAVSPSNGTVSISFSEILKNVSKFDDSGLDVSKIAEIEGFIDPFLGKGLEFSSQIKDSKISYMLKPFGSNYSIEPSASAADDIKARIGSITPAGLTAKPSSIFIFSFGNLLKNVMEVASQFETDPEESAEIKKTIAALPKSKPYGILALAYAEGSVYRTRMNISTDELKWFASFFKNLTAVSRQKAYEGLEELDEDYGEEVEFEAFDAEDAEDSDAEAETSDEKNAEVIDVQIAE